MATYAQLAMAAQEAKDRAGWETARDRESARRTKAAKWGGMGRTLGLLGAGLATAATGGLAAPVAAGLVGLGGLAGRSAGRALAGGRERDADKSVDALFGQGNQRRWAKSIGDYQAGMRERMLTDAGRDAFSAFAMQKYMPKVQDLYKKGMSRWQDFAKTPGEKLAMLTGDPNADLVINQAKAQSEAIAGLDRMPGQPAFSKADPSTWGRTPPPGSSTLGPTPTPAITNPIGPYGVDPIKQFGTDPLGATNISDPLSAVPVPWRPTVPLSDTYDAAITKAAGMRTMNDPGRITNLEVLKSMGLPAPPPQDFLGGMSYDQYMNLSDEAFEGNLLNLINQ